MLHSELREGVGPRWFDPFRRAGSEGLKRRIRELTAEFLAAEEVLGVRQRRRRGKDLGVLFLTLEALLTDLLHLAITAPGEPLQVTRSKAVLGKASRYRPPVISETFPKLLDLMAHPEVGWIEEDARGWWRSDTASGTTLIRPTQRLTSRFSLTAGTLQGLTRDPGEEAIILKSRRPSYREEGDLLEYADTPRTDRFRAEVQAINEWLAGLALSIRPGGALELDTGARFLRRRFGQGSPAFDKGGRLFGGFWMAMTKPDRQFLEIEGEPPCTLDYSATFLRLAYAREGLGSVCGGSDLYAIPGLEGCREGVKRMVNPLFFRSTPMRRFPRGGTNRLFPPGSRCRDVVAAIKQAHPKVSHLFETEVGHDLMHTESEIMVRCLMRAMEQDLPALPVHDALIVPASRAAEAGNLMRVCWREITGQEPVVGIQ